MALIYTVYYVHRLRVLTEKRHDRLPAPQPCVTRVPRSRAHGGLLLSHPWCVSLTSYNDGIMLLVVCGYSGAPSQSPGFERIPAPAFEFVTIWIRHPSGLTIHLIEGTPDFRLCEGPNRDASTGERSKRLFTHDVLDPAHLRRGHHLAFDISDMEALKATLDKVLRTITDVFAHRTRRHPQREVTRVGACCCLCCYRRAFRTT